VDDASNVVDEMMDDATIIKNHHLQYLSYSAFSAAKHDNWERRNAFPFPLVSC
jgi:hypothetical protein